MPERNTTATNLATNLATNSSEATPHNLTALDGPAFSPDRLTVRGRDLNDLVGSLSYPAAIYHLLTGELPSRSQAHTLDQWLLTALRAVSLDHPVAQLVQQSARAGASDIGAVLAGLALLDGLGAQSIGPLDPTPLDTLGLSAYREGLTYFAIAPLLHTLALEAGNAGKVGRRLALLGDSETEEYVGAIYALVRGEPLPNNESVDRTRATFDNVLVAFHAGLGKVAPTIALPRAASATRTSTAMALAAGYTAAGPAHVGACKMVMAYYAEIVATSPSQEQNILVTHARAALHTRLHGGGRVAGFGHPLFRQDPRNPHLRDLVTAQGITSPYLVVYDTIAAGMVEERNLYPNIDAIAAALFLTLGIAPQYGTALFLCARMAAMVAHIEEARHERPFGVQPAKK